MEILTREDEQKLHTITLVVYILQAVSLFVGVTALVAIIINYIKRDDWRGSAYESHCIWQMRTFWYALLGYIVAGMLVFAFGLGVLIAGVVWLWYVYRIVKGILYFNDGKAMPL